ncbi:hypothetical protein BHE90_017698 [Fusarium euwallaceae]|uniref:Uncharacterized protein n=1 Tax=Fusarium euwallaceae TaxID=1147111 RepID=A0A430KWP9_9HYPO|nr:hypothetical protein BHE90_017698 [Fusarium euwallaceae]
MAAASFSSLFSSADPGGGGETDKVPRSGAYERWKGAETPFTALSRVRGDEHCSPEDVAELQFEQGDACVVVLRFQPEADCLCAILRKCLETLPGDGASCATAYAGWETVPSPDGLVCVVMLTWLAGEVEPDDVASWVDVSDAVAAETPVDGFVQKLSGIDHLNLWQMNREAVLGRMVSLERDGDGQELVEDVLFCRIPEGKIGAELSLFGQGRESGLSLLH